MSTETNTHSVGDSSLDNVLGRVGEAVCALDDEWRFTFVNDQAGEMLEHTPGELLGEDIWEIVPDIEDGIVGERLRQAVETQTSTRFDSYSESTERWFKVRIYPSDDGVTACFYDITDERGEQLDLQRKRRLFETVFEETEDALVVADTDRRITDFNPAAEQLFGYDASEVIGTKTRILYADPDDYDRQGAQRFNEDAQERDETYVVEYERADGTTFEGETLGTSLKSPDDETLAFLGSIRDATARIAYEEEIEDRKDALRSFHEIATDEDRSFDKQVEALIKLGSDHLRLDTGLMSDIDGEEYTVEHAIAPEGAVEQGDQYNLGETYCDLVVESGELVAVTGDGSDDSSGHPADRATELGSYVGVPVVVDGEQYGTLSFFGTEPRPKPFTDGERTFVRVLAQWLGKELSRQRSTQRAAANRDRLRQIIDILPQLVFAKDRNGEYILANQAIADAYGTTVEELEGATDADFADSEEEVKQFREDDIAVIESGAPKEIPDEPLTTADGEKLRLQTTKIPYDPVDHETEAVLGVATDITELKHRERELEETTQRLNVALEGTNTGVWEWSLATDEVVWSESMEQLFGLDPGTFAGTFDAFAERVHPDDLPDLEDSLEQTVTNGGTLQAEYRIRRDDGRQIWGEVRAELLERGDESQRMVGIVTDITDRKERDAEIELQSKAMEVAMDGIAILDDDEYVYMNQAHADIFDYDPEQLLGREWRDLYEEGEIERFEAEVFPSLGEDGEWRGEALGRKRDGTAVYQDLGLSLLDSGELICTNRDITESKQREQELRDLNERLDLAVEGGRIGIWDWNMETDHVTFNEQWAAMLGFSLDELEPTLETWENRVHPADMAHVEEQLEAHIAGETELYDCEHRMQSKSGDWKWIRDVGKVVDRDEDRTPTRAVGIHLDITDQKESELFLEEERDMFAQGPAVVFKWRNDDGWPVEYVSENVTETFGYTPEQLQSGAVQYMELLHEDDTERVANEVESHSDETTERFSHDPYRMVTSSGEIRWVTDNTKIIRNDGEVTHYLGYLIDITEQKRLEESLRDSEQSLRELTDVASDTDQSFEEKLSTLLELGRERLDIPYGFLNRIDGETQQVVQAVGDHPQLQTDATAPRSETYCRKTIQQDSVLDISDAIEEGWEDDPAYERFDLGCYIGGTVFVNGDRYGTLCFADHSSRDHAFDDSERAFVELLVQWISYELASNSFETKLREMNDTAQRLMSAPTRSEVAAITIESARSVLEMEMTGIWWYDQKADTLVPERQTDEATAIVDEQPTFERGDSLAWEAFEAGEVRAYDELRNVAGRYDESSELRSEIIVPLGKHGVIITSSTEQRAFSETDLNLLEVLSATVESALTRAQREETLRETQRKLKQSNEELEQFAYAASHDLQEPLRTVSSYLTLLERRYGEELDEDAVEFIDFAVDGADRMRNMIKALLAYSRVDTRGQGFESVGAVTLFERVTQDLKMTIEETDATVSTPTTELAVEGDESQLAQLFQNLVENGIKYNEQRPEVEITATRHDGMVTFEVTDNGIGIESDQTEEIFEVFQRLHTREEFAGTGIGLSICRKIVDRHGGEITVESEPGEGSTFVVTLPQGDTSDD